MGIKELLKMEGREEGREEGVEIGREEVREQLTFEHVKALLKKTEFSVREIAEMFSLSEYYVRKVKKSIQLN